jgi:hypothetical protein
VYTSVRTLTNRARPRPQNFAPPRSWIRVGHGEPFRATEYVGADGAGPLGIRQAGATADPGDLVAPCPTPPGRPALSPAGRAGMATARRSPASHALHCPRLPGRRNIRRSLLGQSLQPDPLDEHRSGQSGYLTLPGEHGRMILHGLRGEGGSMEPEIPPVDGPCGDPVAHGGVQAAVPPRG